MKKTKLLIATTNVGKVEEIKSFLYDLPFELLSLSDLPKKIKEPEETEPTTEGNAILKAKYYATKTGLLSLADDGGMFVNALNGWPGVISARIANSPAERRKIILNKMLGIKNRQASFQASLALYNPADKSIFVSFGEIKGRVLKKEISVSAGFGYDPIFYVSDLKKAYSQMTLQEKNSCSHRSKALSKIKYFLQNQYGVKHLVVPLAFIIKNGKLLISLRNDPHRREMHKKWEFPGGIVDFGETTESTVIKEVEEEVGYKVKVIKQLQGIEVKDHHFPNFSYQVYLIPYVCKIIGGKISLSDAEVLDVKWIKLAERKKYKFMPGDDKMLNKFMPELKQIIKEFKL